MTDVQPPPPPLIPMARVVCRVGPLVTLGQAKYGERRYVPLLGGEVAGAELNGEIVEGGVDWQINRADGVLDIAAHYVIRATDGALIEVQSDGMRHASADVMAALARGDVVSREAYYFRTVMRFQTGATAWLHLNKLLALAVGERRADRVVLDVYRVT
ncbi:MAG: DUF3237 domain-containing protein [Rubrivivax sp.]|nr:MAG: DUF3237 domain-containing protein [Rubrivivax sp.]